MSTFTCMFSNRLCLISLYMWFHTRIFFLLVKGQKRLKQNLIGTGSFFAQCSSITPLSMFCVHSLLMSALMSDCVCEVLLTHRFPSNYCSIRTTLSLLRAFPYRLGGNVLCNQTLTCLNKAQNHVVDSCRVTLMQNHHQRKKVMHSQVKQFSFRQISCHHFWATDADVSTVTSATGEKSGKPQNLILTQFSVYNGILACM